MMAHIFDMRRLHQGCGESLQCNLLDLVALIRPGLSLRPQEGLKGKQRKKRRQGVQKSMRLWG